MVLAAPSITADPRSWPVPDGPLWAGALAGGDLLDDAGCAPSWRPATEKTVRQVYAQWLRFVAETGALEPGTRPDQRVTPARVTAFIAHLTERGLSLYTVGHYLKLIGWAVAVLVPFSALDWLREMARRLGRSRRSSSGAKTAKLKSSRTLFDLGLRMMNRAEGEATAFKRASRYRDGLAIALLTARPLRASNFVGIHIEVQLRRTPDGWLIDLPESETKQHRQWRCAVPAVLTARIDHYLSVHRPALLNGRSSLAFWVSSRGDHWSRSGLLRATRRATERAFGAPINPHLFRDAAATSFAIEDPEHVRASAILLGHCSLDTTQRYYNQARCLDAARKHMRVIRKLRNGRKPPR